MTMPGFSAAGAALFGGVGAGRFPGVFAVVAALALFSSLPAIAYDLAPNAKIIATAAGCKCSEGGKTWACRKLATWRCPGTTAPKLSCSEDPTVACAWLPAECDALPTQSICVLEDKP